jgi:hypothetical protein
MTRPLPLWRFECLLAIEQFLRKYPQTPVYTDSDGMDGLTVPEVITYIDWLRRKKLIGKSQWRILHAKIEREVHALESSI